MFRTIITAHRPSDGFFIRFTYEKSTIPTKQNLMDYMNSRWNYQASEMGFTYPEEFYIEAFSSIYLYIFNIWFALSWLDHWNDEFNENNLPIHSRPFFHLTTHLIDDRDTLLNLDFFKIS